MSYITREDKIAFWLIVVLLTAAIILVMSLLVGANILVWNMIFSMIGSV